MKNRTRNRPVDDAKPPPPPLPTLRFVGGPMHCWPVPNECLGMLVLFVNGPEGPAQYSLGVLEDEVTGQRISFYGYDLLEDVEEMERLVLQVHRPC